MKDVFVADAHLLDPTAENYRRFLKFLDEGRGQIRTLFLLGDIFEFWIGYDHVVFTPYVPVLEALRRLRETGTRIVYVEGNHDFRLGPYFEQVLDCTILPDGGEIDIDGQKVLIVHGDLIDATDSGYRLLRRCLRSLPFRLIQRVLSPDLAWKIARWGGRQSQKKHASYNRSRQVEEMVSAFAAEKLAGGCQCVISAHFHTPFFKEQENGTTIALGDWISQYSYASHENGRFSLHSY